MADPRAPVVAMAGNPNVGKSTLFNVLTGSKRQIGNWPGTTVEVARAPWRLSREVALIDLPGTYSLEPMSPDEELTRDLILGGDPADRPDLVILVLDAANLPRSLYLLAHLRELSLRLVVALTMLDVATSRGLDVDIEALAGATGAPVVPVDPRRDTGLQDLAAAVTTTLTRPAPLPRHRTEVTGQLGEEIAADPELADAEERFAWVEGILDQAVRRPDATRPTWSDRVDRIVLSPMAGPLVFLGVMWLVFQATTTVAAPIQELLDSLVAGPVSTAVQATLAAIGLGDTWVSGLLIDGLVAGVGMVLTFLPLMAIMFALLAILEGSGYLARAAVVTDRLMRMIGLPGRAFLPLIVGFGCNVPAITATRALPDARHRPLTALLVPFTSCSARLTVYVLVGVTFFGRRAGTVVFAMYVLSIVLVVLVGRLLRSTLLRSLPYEPLVLDLPPYHRPTVRQTWAVTWLRLQGFLRTAGGIIVATVVAVWLLGSIPVGGGSFGAVAMKDSAFGRSAQALAPAFEPAGFGDWHATSALLTGFVAKEAVVSTWAQTHAPEPGELRDQGSLGADLRGDFELSSGGHVTPAVLAFLVFLLAYTPCVATLATQWREIGGRWTTIGLVLQLTVAWTLAVVVFQVGRLIV